MWNCASSCNSGPVDDSRKYGRPIVTVSKPRIAPIGASSSTADFQARLGAIGKKTSETANSAYHGTRLDVSHICDVMGRLVKTTGDGIYAVFADPTDAIDAALQLQLALVDPDAGLSLGYAMNRLWWVGRVCSSAPSGRILAAARWDRRALPTKPDYGLSG